jgi:tRNA A37 methylthiotransferase MiaB
VYLIEEAYGPKDTIAKFYPAFRLPTEKSGRLSYGIGRAGCQERYAWCSVRKTRGKPRSEMLGKGVEHVG